MDLKTTAGNKFKVFLEMIKFEHTLFALPFAYLGLFYAEGGLPRLSVFLWVTVAMVGLRTASMAFNRLADRRIDAQNPRTQGWALPRGDLSPRFVVGAAAVSLLVYFLAAANLNKLCLFLSPIPAVMMLIYPFMKRFTWFAHFFLGMILGIAPAAGWVASQGTITSECWLLWAAVFLWVAGFDMIYALQDIQFDTKQGLHSFPSRFGYSASVITTRVLHLAMLLLLFQFGQSAGFGAIYWAGLGLCVFFLLREHWVVARDGLSGISEAFFRMNVLISLTLFLTVSLEQFLG